MTPDDALDVENCVAILRKKVHQNHGCLFLMYTNPAVGALPNHFVKIALIGHSSEVSDLLALVAKKHPDFKKTLQNTADLLPPKIRVLQPSEKELMIKDIIALGKMRDRYPEISQILRMLQNHVKEKVTTKSKISA
ncbi:MAG: hypothetical protein AAF634_05010 [Bacteroidota bacterium]